MAAVPGVIGGVALQSATAGYHLVMDDDSVDGCELDFADPATVSTDEDVDALLMFADLPWTGRVWNGRPVIEPQALAQRIVDLRALDRRELFGA